jgi:dienelactone hydrolase
MNSPCSHKPSFNRNEFLPVKSGTSLFCTVAQLCLSIFILSGCDHPPAPASSINPGFRDASASLPDVQLDSLADISVNALRQRTYGSTLRLELDLSRSRAGDAYREHFDSGTPLPYSTYVGSYVSDGNRIYTRIDIPAEPAGPGGYPAIIFVHGWVGREAAPGYDFSYTPDSFYSRMIDAYVKAGFLVLSPALRGHGTVNGIPADGIEFLETWDNGSYLSPMFYAIDVLNLLEGVQTLENIDWGRWGLPRTVRVDTRRLNISGHSQGGDAVLTALAVSGEGSAIHNALAAGSISSGCYGPRFEQVEIYGPMATALEAFMSGDGSWTGTAIGLGGEVNPNFVFGYPSDWIGTVDPRSPEWTWQAETWSAPSVAAALETKYSEMYDTINRQVADLSDVRFRVEMDNRGKAFVAHDPRVTEAMQKIGAFDFEQFLTEPLHLHHSDRDYYSIPRWNEDLASRIDAAGGRVTNFSYRGNNHSLLISPYDWFSGGEVIEGLGYMIERDLALFSSGEIRPQSSPGDDLVSIPALRRYSQTMRNEFFPEFEREPLEGTKRRVVRFTVDGLIQYALVLEPESEPPEKGWPVLIMNHGFHPNPPENGRKADGSSDRPGDYYRGIPLAFARAGFLVVVPDFRGHNISEGIEFTTLDNASYWYARDVIAAFRALGSLPGADTEQVFMWGHSMGGSITLRVLMALGDEVRGASIWSSAADIDSITDQWPLTDIETPLNIHHSVDDGVTPFAGSAELHARLQDLNKVSALYPVNGDLHLFASSELETAIQRDLTFFRKFIMNPIDD